VIARISVKDLNNKVAVITGGASGIGLAMAESFGAEGMKLVIADIQPGALETALANLRAKGFEAIGVVTDVSKLASVEALAKAALDAFGKVHVVVNNAGVSITGPIWKLSLDDWRWVYDVNVWGVVHGVKVFTPILIDQAEPAHIINTASLASFNGTGEHSPYCSSKAAVLSISQSLYSELTAWNTEIGVSVVCPGMVATQIHKSNRNRPGEDKPWSDREWADEAHAKGSEEFQGRGVEASVIADVTLEALKENRFYVFQGERWREMISAMTERTLAGQNPAVATWGPDLRPKPIATETA
jgi:NAD(P)-dependent dehydrogenase (short-subunit alcohol dehydrogenase family)